jgi:type II secretory pathway component PulF
VPIAECVRKSVDLAGNTTVRKWLEGAVRSAEAGSPVSDGFSPRLPEPFVEMWRIGEEAGKLDETAARLADMAADDSQRLFEQLAIWLPRVIYVLVSIFIIINIFRGFAAIYGPTLKMLDET